MKFRTGIACTFAALVASAAALAQNAPDTIDAHIAVAKGAAGEDFRGTFVNLCLPAAARGGGAGGGARGVAGGGGAPGAAGRGAAAGGGAPGAAGRGAAAGGGAPGPGGRGAAAAGAPGAAPAPRPAPPRETWYAPPYKVFDNLYWLGTRAHSSWALTSSAGIILIDTNFNYAIEPEIVDGMKTMHLDPAQVKYVVVSHAHTDHDEGARLFQERYKSHVIFGAEDWDMIDRQASMPGGKPVRDIVATDGQKVTVGDTTLTIYLTPGHTDGTLSYIFPVKDHGKTVTVAYSGGTLTGNFGTNGAKWDQYIASQQKIAKAAADAGATVIISNHSEYDGAYTKARLVDVKRAPGEDNPFVVGADGVQRYFTVMSECATASKMRNNAH